MFCLCNALSKKYVCIRQVSESVCTYLACFLCLIVLLRQDKRREVGARTHAAARAREDAADGLDMKEADTMGGGDSFHETLARAKHGKQRRQTAKTVSWCRCLLTCP